MRKHLTLKPVLALLSLTAAVACTGAPSDEAAFSGAGAGAGADGRDDDPTSQTSPDSDEGTGRTMRERRSTPVPYRGVNLAGAEFGEAIPGEEGSEYAFPKGEQLEYYVSKGMNTFRLGFKWERMQSVRYAELDEAHTRNIDALVSEAKAKGARVILNPHNFARYYGKTVGSPEVPNEVFADFWRKLASRYHGNDNVMFNLVNEPHDMPTEQWVSAANAAIAAIRETGATNTIIVPGNSWTGAHSWYSTSYGTPNAVAMLDIVDPGDNILFEAHQYMDDNSSGSSDECVSRTVGRERLAPFVRWLRENGKRGVVGELAGGRNADCNEAVTEMLSYVMESSDVLDGWLWWAGGPMWGDYRFSLEPAAGVDRPQMAVIRPFLFSSAWKR